jgi:phosphoribosylaminoimidazolecarboxamide formyltransferase / IMP cyclohydrolase
MSEKKLTDMYRTIQTDSFPNKMEISLFNSNEKQTLLYEKVTWDIGGRTLGLRYGENPDQEAALYRLINGNLSLGSVKCIKAGKYLCSDMEILQSGKHPGKINITDADSALNILRYFSDTPCTVIIKHNNPCGVALGSSLAESYTKAHMADRIAAFGGAIAVNRELDRQTAELITESYSEVVVAPEYGEGTLEILSSKKNLRILKIGNIEHLQSYIGEVFLDFKSLIDGGIVVQKAYSPVTLSKLDFIDPEATHKGNTYRISRKPGEDEMGDMLFGWLVESGVTSNSVIYVKDSVTVGIGTGEQDRVGVAEIARDKAYRKMADRIAWERHKTPLSLLQSTEQRREIETVVNSQNGGLRDSVMISDAFFPFRDGVDVGLKEGVTAIVQPGGSLNDHEVIEACNESGATMVFTGQRSFKH